MSHESSYKLVSGFSSKVRIRVRIRLGLTLGSGVGVPVLFSHSLTH